jgi:IS30 family transposase
MLYLITDFNELTESDVAGIACLLNERPRKTRDFQALKEVFSNLR